MTDTDTFHWEETLRQSVSAADWQRVLDDRAKAALTIAPVIPPVPPVEPESQHSVENKKSFGQRMVASRQAARERRTEASSNDIQ